MILHTETWFAHHLPRWGDWLEERANWAEFNAEAMRLGKKFTPKQRERALDAMHRIRQGVPEDTP